jgi:hypothetical protein
LRGEMRGIPDNCETVHVLSGCISTVCRRVKLIGTWVSNSGTCRRADSVGVGFYDTKVGFFTADIVFRQSKTKFGWLGGRAGGTSRFSSLGEQSL